MSTNKQALRIPKREKHNWGQAVMHTCDFCGQYAMTITREDGEHSCASCCDAEYATVLTCALEMAIDRAEAAEKRIAELEVRAFNPALLDVIAERHRQVSAEGWTPEHDDQYEHGQLAGAASCYARHVNARGWIFNTDPGSYQAETESTNWPWHHEWWKPTSPRRDLVKAGALILAEIERIDRAAGITVKGECTGGECE